MILSAILCPRLFLIIAVSQGLTHNYQGKLFTSIGFAITLVYLWVLHICILYINHLYIWNQGNNAVSWLSPKRLCGSSFNRAKKPVELYWKKGILTQLFSCECCEIFKNTICTEHLRWLLPSEPIVISVSVLMKWKKKSLIVQRMTRSRYKKY